jgi:hypothetical protein
MADIATYSSFIKVGSRNGGLMEIEDISKDDWMRDVEFGRDRVCWEGESLLDERRARDMAVVGEGVTATADCGDATHFRDVTKPDFALFLASMAT